AFNRAVFISIGKVTESVVAIGFCIAGLLTILPSRILAHSRGAPGARALAERWNRCKAKCRGAFPLSQHETAYRGWFSYRSVFSIFAGCRSWKLVRARSVRPAEARGRRGFRHAARPARNARR